MDTDIFSLHFRRLALPIEGAPEIANAFAFPGGDIIITDELIRIAENQQEIDAILYHEVAHVLHNHGLKQVVQSALVTVIITMIVDRESLLEEILLGLPVFFFQNHYSQKYETEADIFAFELMLKTNINPTVLSSILGKISMDKKEAAQNNKQDSNYFSTHPTTNERVEMAERYAKQFSEQQQALGNVNQ
ncbi:MAG: M48 family metallopeptidase [Gammaproteobacteria bacterium]|nr:M48 family metallopeptidase [Gammaproteobacteria bacterium]